MQPQQNSPSTRAGKNGVSVGIGAGVGVGVGVWEKVECGVDDGVGGSVADGGGEPIVKLVFGNSSPSGDGFDAVVGNGAGDVGGGDLGDGAVKSAPESSGNALET